MVVVAVALRTQPETAIASVMQWLSLIKARATDCCDKMKKSAPDVLSALLEATAELLRLHEHPDRYSGGVITSPIHPGIDILA